MAKPVRTFADAAEQGMIIRVECPCGRVEHFVARDLVRCWGEHRLLSQHRFKCRECTPPVITVTPLPIDLDRMPSGKIMRLKAGGRYGDPEWMRVSFRN